MHVMRHSSTAIEEVRRLADTGHHADVIAVLDARPRTEIEESPTLALLYGTAHARIGRHAEGRRWIDRALDRAREAGDYALEIRALNACGAVAFVEGRIDQAADFFTQALLAASRAGDHATIGRCSNNLGSINSLRGRYAEAVGSHSVALAAFERASLPQGAAEAHHNLGIAYRQQGELERALLESRFATREAKVAGDCTLVAMTSRGRAEIHVDRGELELAQQEIDDAIAEHRRLRDEAEETQDLRIVAAIRVALGDHEEARRTLLAVASRAESQGRLQLVAEAKRDLAYLLRNMGRHDEATANARAAIKLFEELGAEAEIRKLDSHEWGYHPITLELQRSLEPLNEAQRLADAGRYADLVAYLGGRPPEALENSPSLAVVYGIGLAKLGRLGEGQQWVVIALARARALGDRAVEIRALNTYGAIALERGGIDAAVDFFTRAQAEAMREGDLENVARASNNLGIVANMQGDYGRAIGAYTLAIAAYQRARAEGGVAETNHNLGITYRDQGKLVQAMAAADRAIQDADALGDASLKAQALAGRAEIRIADNDPRIALREAERALELHSELGDVVRETEDLRILAGALAAADQFEEAGAMLREVIARATEHGRPLLVATAQRDLARLLDRNAQTADARAVAMEARETFGQLGARVEVQRLDDFLATMTLASA